MFRLITPLLVVLVGSAPALPAQDLVANGSFDMHVAYWGLYYEDPGDTLDWDSEDSEGDPDSGSMQLFDAAPSGSFMSGQCIPVLGGNPYRFSGDMKIGTGVGTIKVLVQEFPDFTCDSGVLANHDGISTSVGIWIAVDETANLDPAANTVRLAGWFYNTGTGSAVAKFDEMTLSSDTVVFFDHFEYGDLLRWDQWVPGP